MSDIKRRELVKLLGGAAVAWPLAARAQPRLPVVGWLSARPRARAAASEGFVEGLRDAGLVEDRDFIIEHRSADDQFDRLPALAADLVQKRVSVLAALGSMALAAAA